MEIVTKLVEAGKNLFSYLTWGKIAMLFVLSLCVILGIGFWENRPLIYNTLSAGKFADGLITTMSPETEQSIKNIVTRHTNIIGLQVVRTDFRNNTRETVYFHTEMPALAREFKHYQDNKVGSSQLFIGGDTIQNDRLISIIEQDFVCVDVPDRILAIMPSATKYAKQICSISVPPQYGKMVGYINIWLTEPISRPEMAYYKSVARAIADEIYDRDVLKHLK